MKNRRVRGRNRTQILFFEVLQVTTRLQGQRLPTARSNVPKRIVKIRVSINLNQSHLNGISQFLGLFLKKAAQRSAIIAGVYILTPGWLKNIGQHIIEQTHPNITYITYSTLPKNWRVPCGFNVQPIKLCYSDNSELVI